MKGTRISILLCALFVFAPFLTFADDSLPISPGCRAATAADQAQRAARGIPPAFQVCPGDETVLGIGEDFDKWFAQLKATSPCFKNTCTLSCRTRNTGAQVCGATASRWNSIGCHPNNNTAIFPSVSYGFAAHIELLRRYCGEQGRCTIARVVNKWTAVAADRESYAAFVSRHSGIPENQVFDPNDVNLMGRLALSMSCFEAGALPYNAQELKQGLAMAAGGPRVAMPANVGQLLNESLTGSYSQSAYPPSTPPGSWAYPPTSINGNNNYMPNYQQMPQNNSQYQNPYQQNYSNGSTPVGGAGAGAANIMVQPKTVARGQTILVSWTSVNMTKDSCKVTFQDQLFAQGSEGSKPFKTVSSDTGTLTFTLTCTDATGAQSVSRASSAIQ